jgi:hypothetical protein
LFAQRRVIVVPAKIGVPPNSRCSYPVRTLEPTGVIELDTSLAPTLGDFFAVWGRPLSKTRLLSFRGDVRAYVAGRRRFGDPRAIPLGRHQEIVLEVGPYVPPHAFYLFPPGR